MVLNATFNNIGGGNQSTRRQTLSHNVVLPESELNKWLDENTQIILTDMIKLCRNVFLKTKKMQF